MQVGERRYAPVIGAATHDDAATRGLAVVSMYGRPAPPTNLQLLLGHATPKVELVRVELLHLTHAALRDGQYDPATD